jgi:glyoxylase-like metal-dependent hydrolase (beta-lactamase superfamily II)
MDQPTASPVPMPTGLAMTVSPLVKRILAPNPSAFTYTGTQSYVVGEERLAVVDPGPDEPEHIAALLSAIDGRAVDVILCTHTHRDHSPAARLLAEATGAKVIGCAPLSLKDDGPRSDAAFDPTYGPHAIMNHGDVLTGPGWTLRAVATPGHTSNHLCYALDEDGVLFTGDHVMGWSTSVIAPPDGDMADYMASLQLLMEREDRIYLPAHGEAVENPRRLVRGMIGHRRMREGQILRFIERNGASQIPVMVAEMYKGVHPGLHGAAGRSVLAHLLDLETRGIVRRTDDDGWEKAA